MNYKTILFIGTGRIGKKYTKALTLTLTGILAFWWLRYYVFLLFISGFFVQYFCQKDLLESIESPSGEYIINTYRENCVATTDFVVTGNCVIRIINVKKYILVIMRMIHLYIGWMIKMFLLIIKN